MTQENSESDGNASTSRHTRTFARNLASLSKIKAESSSRKPGLKRSYLLLIPSIFISLAVVWWLNFVDQTGNIEVSIEQVSQTQAGNTKMTGARFSGRTDDGENFEITAEQAVDNMPKQGLIHLLRPDGTIWTKNGSIIKINSLEAILDQSKETTLFQGVVEINQTKPKVNINTSELSVDLVNKIYHSNQPVIVVTENMKITGEDMSINQESGTIYFGGYANLVIMENQQPKHVSNQE